MPVRTLFPGVRIGPFTPRPREAFGLRGRDDARVGGRGSGGFAEARSGPVVAGAEGARPPGLPAG